MFFRNSYQESQANQVGLVFRVQISRPGHPTLAWTFCALFLSPLCTSLSTSRETLRGKLKSAALTGTRDRKSSNADPLWVTIQQVCQHLMQFLATWKKKMMTKTTICDLIIVILREVLSLVEHFNDEIILNYQLGDWGINESSIKLIQ